MIKTTLIEAQNAQHSEALARDYAALGEKLARSNIDIERIKERAKASASPSPLGARAQAARGLRGFRERASPPISSTSSMIAA